ncbi:CRISPR-associated endonuclease Cas3'' [Cloacibacillus sp.]
MEYLAHISGDLTRTQPLDEHLTNTAKTASQFAAAMGESACAYMIGILHDQGKYRNSWMCYLKKASGYDPSIPDELCERGTHSTAGAAWLLNNMSQPESLLLSYTILGHHAGLPDFYDGCGESLTSRLFEDGILKAGLLEEINFGEVKIPEVVFPSQKIAEMQDEYKHLWVRLIFSSLVDSDYLDTEKFMDNDVNAARGTRATLAQLKERFDSFMESKCASASQTQVNKIRAEILKQCILAARGPAGFYSLTVPTGGGKTLSAMAFALEHALKNNKRRVIMAIPYTSIIEQTAKTYKYGTDDDEKIKIMKERGEFLFGEENVLEHHSNIDPDKELYMNFLASQNWDAPVVVTTNVQLFESLLAAKPSRCRKLHNLAHSVIILDEAQKIPAEYLHPVLSVLKGLVKYFGVTVLFCTATQPALTGQIGSSNTCIEGISGCTEIIKDPVRLYEDLKRVEYMVYKNDINVRSSWEEIAEELKKVSQVLCIVNKRRDCRELMKYMPEGTIQLSGLMCGEEISSIITEIKQLLKEGRPVRVVSTQLIEAGVDLDFPEVWRALAQLDSIVQAAGRANREGRLKDDSGNPRLGRVVVFNPESEPFGEIKIGAQITSSLARKADYFDSLSAGSFNLYFKKFYAEHQKLDKCDYEKLLVDETDCGRFQFRSFAEEFKLIDTSGQKTVFVPFADGEKLICQLREGHPDRRLMCRLQHFSVNIPVCLFNDIYQKGGIEVVNNYYVLNNGFYEPGKGVLMGEFYNYDDHNFIY